MNELALKRSVSDSVTEYEHKLAALPAAAQSFSDAAEALKAAATVNGVWGQVHIDTGHVYERTLKDALLKSAWLNIYDGMNLKNLMSANDKKRFEQSLSQLPEFTMENIRATFGDYIIDPMGNILRGLAEVFSELDPSFKSHDKMRIGVKGLPKRVILGGFGAYSSYGKDKLNDILNALAAYQGKPLVTYKEISDLMEDENALLNEREIVVTKYDRDTGEQTESVRTVPGRGIRLRRFGNGNAHLFFEPDTLRDVNMALAKFYGEVLPDCHEAKPETRAASTAVSKDLQYYPTPIGAVHLMLRDVLIREGDKVLEPSCGCGRIMDYVREKAPGAKLWGVEYDDNRAEQARQKGHKVLTGNFLERVPEPDFDFVVMNPPFYGTHYAKHVEHAMKFLKEGGTLVAILPITARYDHDALDKVLETYKSSRWSSPWRDLPVGSFRESGTNINTTVLTLHK